MTKHATLTQDDAKLAASQLRYKCDQQLSALTQQIEAARAELAEVQAQAHKIKEAAVERSQHLAALQLAARTAASAVKDARDDAAVAIGTIGEKQAAHRARELEKVSAGVQAARGFAEEEDGQASRNEAEQLAQRGIREQALQEKLLVSQQQQEAAVGTRDRALAELGIAMHREAEIEIERLRTGVYHARLAMVDAQSALQRGLDEAQARLSDWPALRQQVWKYLPPVDDATSRILRTAKAHLEQLLADRLDLKMSVPEVREAATLMRWTDLLFIGTDLLPHQPLNSRYPQQVLQARLDLVTRILSGYEQAHRHG